MGLGEWRIIASPCSYNGSWRRNKDKELGPLAYGRKSLRHNNGNVGLSRLTEDIAMATDGYANRISGVVSQETE